MRHSARFRECDESGCGRGWAPAASSRDRWRSVVAMQATWSQPVAEVVVFSNDFARRRERPRRPWATSTLQACRMGRKVGCLSSHPTRRTSRTWCRPRPFHDRGGDRGGRPPCGRTKVREARRGRRRDRPPAVRGSTGQVSVDDNHRGRPLGPPICVACGRVQQRQRSRPGAVARPAAELRPDPSPRPKRRRQIAPLAPGLRDVEHRVHDAAQVIAMFAAALARHV